MYWIMANERNSENELSIDDTPTLIEESDLEFDLGEYVKSEIALISHRYRLEPNQFITDYIVAYGFKGLLFSKKLHSIIEDLDIKNIQSFPVDLISDDSNHKSVYFLINVIGSFDIVDYDKSEVTLDEGGDIKFIDSLSFIDTSELDLPPIFRLSSFLPLVIANDEIKQAFEENEITGFKFYKPEDFYL